ncbi:hypothetical protein [Paenibacillus sp.]|uniref:hypothetical protein n=1 Tax=Paenibacillus sp. TaxID=58172 RepID=UPI002D3AC179|nr:hypothetical protein [Paenibacillus sp.]HZG84248.1 hypothetical protein [Paenibacillus sp.]
MKRWDTGNWVWAAVTLVWAVDAALVAAGLVRHTHASAHWTLGLPLLPLAVHGLRLRASIRAWPRGGMGGLLYVAGLWVLAAGQIVESFGDPIANSPLHTAGVVPSAVGMALLMAASIWLLATAVRTKSLPLWAAAAAVAAVFAVIRWNAAQEDNHSAVLLIFTLGYWLLLRVDRRSSPGHGRATTKS